MDGGGLADSSLALQLCRFFVVLDGRRGCLIFPCDFLGKFSEGSFSGWNGSGKVFGRFLFCRYFREEIDDSGKRKKF